MRTSLGAWKSAMSVVVVVMLTLLIACQTVAPLTSAPPTNPPVNPPATPPSSSVVPNPVPANQTFVFCSYADQGCDFKGLRDVRIGSGSSWTVKEFYGGVDSCKYDRFNAVDPNPGGAKTCEVSTHVKTVTLGAPVNPMGPYVNLTKIPLGSRGYSDLRVAASSDPPTPHNNATSGEFRIGCAFSHMNFDDPIVYPGQPGRAHLHTFFGNTRTWAGSTALSIAETGNSTCMGGIANRSAYWVPTLIDTKDGTPLLPEDGLWYYKNGSNLLLSKNIHPMPKGLRMIAGNPAGTPSDYVIGSSWSCSGPVAERGGSIPKNCPVGDYIIMSVTFPQCWNGKDLDSQDHISHLSYAVKDGACPTDFPIGIPEISLNLKYKVYEAGAPARWRLSSDMYPTTQPGGFSIHADWFDGWNEQIKNMWVSRCNVAGFDCHGNLLGDGRGLY